MYLQVLKRAKASSWSLNPATVLASLMGDQDQLMRAQARLKMSGLERDTALFILDKRASCTDGIDLRTVKCWWVDAKTKNDKNNKAIIEECIKYCGRYKLTVTPQ